MSNSQLNDMEGREPFRIRGHKFPFIFLDYRQIGNNIKRQKYTDRIKLLDQKVKNEVPLFSQQTVVQFNSTYLETTDRNEIRRGDTTALGFIFGSILLGFLYFFTPITVSFLFEKDYMFFLIWLSMLSLPIFISYFIFVILSTELFTYRHYPIRFNRENRKVYVRKYNRKIETYKWDDLVFFIAYLKEGMDIKAVTLEKDGTTIKSMFALAFSHADIDDSLVSYFEFIRRYMESDDQELKEVKDVVRYIYPIHHQRETIRTSIKRVALYDFYHTYLNTEYPKESFYWHPSVLIVLPFLFLRVLGRRISMLTSIKHTFPERIESECRIDPMDVNDLNKNLPEGNFEPKAPLWKVIVYGLATIIAIIVMLFVFAFLVDGITGARGDYPRMVEKLWYVVSLGWLS
ncbi:DUF6708 domain-containing protein [Psychrobacter fozii]|uniref:DUF6708 domain-containing protein n=1 Tax=Psychrobacter fozii TaxID=198480 RepID=UPI00191931A8|nr:DUF6708 domain-containing protein [Psychrobacter fozii]